MLLLGPTSVDHFKVKLICLAKEIIAYCPLLMQNWHTFLMVATTVQSCSLRLCLSPIRLLHTAFYGATTFYPCSNIMVMGMPALKQKLGTGLDDLSLIF